MTEGQACAFFIVTIGILATSWMLFLRWLERSERTEPETTKERIERKRQWAEVAREFAASHPLTEQELSERARIDQLLRLPEDLARASAEQLLADRAKLHCSPLSATESLRITGLTPRLREFFTVHGNLGAVRKHSESIIAIGPRYFQTLDELPNQIIIGGSFWDEGGCSTFLIDNLKGSIVAYHEGWLPDEGFDPEVDELVALAPTIDHLILILENDDLEDPLVAFELDPKVFSRP